MSIWHSDGQSECITGPRLAQPACSGAWLFACCAAFIAWCTLAGVAHAGEVPEDAVSRSLGLAPRFLDSASLVYAYPQRAVGPDSSTVTAGAPLARPTLWAGGEDVSSTRHNLGGLWRNRSAGLFVLSQPAALRGTSLPDVYTIHPNTGHLLQAGGAARWKAWRVGVAFRATRDREEWGQAFDRGGISTDDIRAYQNELDYRELCVGVGFETRAIQADAAFEWQDESYEEASIDVSGDVVRALQATGTARGWSGVSARITVPVGDALSVVAAGRVRAADRNWDGTQYLPTTMRRVGFGERSKHWSADVGLVVRRSVHQRVIVAVSYAYYDEPLAGVESNNLELTSNKSSAGSVTGAVEQRLWRELIGRASVSIRYAQTEFVSQYFREDAVDMNSRRDETLGDLFAWGLAYSWRNLRAEGAMRVPPQVSSPIGVFDLYVTF